MSEREEGSGIESPLRSVLLKCTRKGWLHWHLCLCEQSNEVIRNGGLGGELGWGGGKAAALQSASLGAAGMCEVLCLLDT